MKKISIEFLYLDLITCERCMATGETFDKALSVLAPVFETLDYSVSVNRINITTKELALQHRFISSPTIRVNGMDISTELKKVIVRIAEIYVVAVRIVVSSPMTVMNMKSLQPL